MEYILANGWEEAKDAAAVICYMTAGERIRFTDPALQAAYAHVFDADDVRAEAGKVLSFRLPVNGRFVTVLAAGMDPAAADPMDQLRKLTGRAGTMLKELDVRIIYIDGISGMTQEMLSVLCATLPLCEYAFDKYHSKKSGYRGVRVFLHAAGTADPAVPMTAAQMTAASAEGLLLADSVCAARDLVNDQAESMTPLAMAACVTELGKQYGFETEILDRARCEELGMGLFLAVARGSANEPAFIIMRYHGGAPDAAPIGFVGKGITYDSGGYHIKTGGMESMYMDMNGGAGVIGAMCAIAGAQLPVNITAVVAACENMVDAKAFRNGDVLTSMNGKTVFVQNTDAEGRLTMADAITYCIRNEHPSEIIEMAGLTGSVCNFYGDACAAALPTDMVLFDRIASLTPLTGERYACMPDFPEYHESLKSPYADITNAPQSTPGICAALFLCSFSEDVPFISIDTGKMPFNSRVYDGHPAGATGFGVHTLYRYAKARAAAADALWK